jgi:hypothetical protein
MALSPVTAPGRSVVETLRIVELAAWAVLSATVAALLVLSLVGAFVVSSQSVALPVLALLLAAVFGTVALVAAEFAFE